jgi:hypothetical protein
MEELRVKTRFFSPCAAGVSLKFVTLPQFHYWKDVGEAD